MTEDFYEAFERFCIMTENQDVDDITALKYVQSKYGREIAVQIWEVLQEMTEYEFLLQDRITKIKSINEQYDLEHNAYISFSGGKDSCVLSAIIDIALPHNNIPRVYVNTGIEFKSVIESVKQKQKEDTRITIINARVNIQKMLNEKGYPFKSKDYSGKLATFQNRGFTNFLRSFYEKGGMYGCPEKLKYQWNENFRLKVSDKCCHELKKKPLENYLKESEKKTAILGLRKGEGGRRQTIQNCVFFEKGTNNLKKFYPLLVCDDEFIKQFVNEFNIKLPDIYKYLKRTGCKGCPYSPDLQYQLDIMSSYYPNERKQCEMIWNPVYEEYRRIGYRLQNTLFD